MSISVRQWSDSSASVELEHSLIGRLVALCVGHSGIVLAVALGFFATSAQYVLRHFEMTTDTADLLSPQLPWRERERAFNAAFPQAGSNVVVVIDAKTPELSEEATARLVRRLRTETSLFHTVERPDGGAFWAHNRLLFASTAEVKTLTSQLLRVQPFLGSMAADPSLRGLANTLSLMLLGVATAQAPSDAFRASIRNLAHSLRDLELGKPSFFSWHQLITGQTAPDNRELRHIVLIDPLLDYTRLQPGRLPIDAIRDAAKRLHLDRAHGVRVRVTGPVALKDDEFATLTQRAGLIACLAAGAIILMLWFAVRSPWLIAAILVTMLAGLVTATAFGLVLFHRFNLISVAFIPLFVGIGMDLGIQFSVRYRAVRSAGWEVGPALVASGRTMGKSLTLAASAIGVGFLAFAPTAYYGVSQLGVIAGFGMLAALALNLTLLPALIAIARPPGERASATAGRSAEIENYVARHRRWVVALGAAAALICATLLPRLHFDFDPMHLRNRDVESVATLIDLTRDPDQSSMTLEVIRDSLAAADRLAAIFRKNPTVYNARTLSSFLPTDQSEKIALLSDTASLMDLTLNPIAVAPPPTDQQVIESLERVAKNLRRTPFGDPSLRADARDLAREFDQLALGGRSLRTAATRMLIPGFVTTLAQLRALLHPVPVSIRTLPLELVRQWQTADGRARVSVSPRGDSNSDAVLRRFVAAGLKIAPDATGTVIYIQAYARAVAKAFIEAGVLSFIAISCLLFIALHRLREVAVTMAPILLTGLLTLGTCVLIGQPLNFANIIALPLLFGIGVAFHIYFVMSWRTGASQLLTSSLARGVFFSALATATGFGSLWASKHPGTASMGKLLMISLVWTLVSALLFQPALMGLVSPTSRSTRASS